MNRFKHAVDISKHVVVPETQNAIAISLEHFGPPCIRDCRQCVLTTVDLNNQTRGVTCKVDDVLLDTDLPAEMRIPHWKAMTQVPPKLALSLRWRGTHLTGEAALRQRGH